MERNVLQGNQFLPPLPSFTGAVQREVDLNVDFAHEIEPFLGKCLVLPLLHQTDPDSFPSLPGVLILL